MTEKKKQYCARCQREMDWEAKEIVNHMSREGLIQLVFALQDKIKK